MAATDRHKGGVLLVFVCCLLGCYGFHWNETVSLANATVIKACEGQTVTFRWLYDLDPSDHLHGVQWHFNAKYYENTTDFLMATMIMNNFLTVADWTGRLQFEPNAGLVLTFVGVGDSGTYTVSADIERHGAFVTELRTVELTVSQAPVLESSGLEAQLLPEARQVDGSGHWMLQLTCQGLRSLGQPPVNVVWKTPSGHVIQSSVINNVTAYLNLMTSEVEDGDYVCMVDNSSESAACASSHSPMFVGDSVTVDRVQARFSVLEGQMAALHSENQQLQLQTQQMSHQLHNLTSENQQMSHQLHNVTSENQLLEHKAEEMTNQLHNLTSENQLLEHKAEVMSNQLQNLTSENQQMAHQLQTVANENQQLQIQNEDLGRELNNTKQKLQGLSDFAYHAHPPRSCDDVKRLYSQSSGVYVISPQAADDALTVYCDLQTDSHGWMVIQRRQDGSVDFYRNWADYEAGFGNNTGEFWIGLQTLYQLTSRQNYSLRVDLEDFQGNKAYAVYTHFSVSGPADNYRLSVSGYSGTAGDSMALLSSNNGMQFSTPDRDHDAYSVSNNHGSWWFSNCGNSNLNGLYKPDGATGVDGITWYTWHSDWRSMKHAEMKIRPRNG